MTRRSHGANWKLHYGECKRNMLLLLRDFVGTLDFHQVGTFMYITIFFLYGCTLGANFMGSHLLGMYMWYWKLQCWRTVLNKATRGCIDQPCNTKPGRVGQLSFRYCILITWPIIGATHSSHINPFNIIQHVLSGPRPSKTTGTVLFSNSLLQELGM